MSTGRTFPTGVGAPILLEGLQVIGRVRPLHLIHRFQALLTLADGWAYARLYQSTQQRNDALSGWLHFYNHHRAHSAIGGRPPATRLPNVPGHHT